LEIQAFAAIGAIPMVPVARSVVLVILNLRLVRNVAPFLVLRWTMIFAALGATAIAVDLLNLLHNLFPGMSLTAVPWKVVVVFILVQSAMSTFT